MQSPPIAAPVRASPPASQAAASSDPLYAALLAGNIGGGIMGSVGAPDPLLDTLDESVGATLRRDAHMVLEKAHGVLLQRGPEASLREWDLWGPLLCSIAMAVALALRSRAAANTESVFTLTVLILWLGAALAGANCRVLGYRVALFPCISFFGYAAAPLAAAAVALLLLPAALLLFPLKAAVVGAATAWSLRAALAILALEPALEDRRLLAALPIYLLYGLLAWIALII